MNLFPFHIAQPRPFGEKRQADLSAVRMRGKRQWRLPGRNTFERGGVMHEDEPGCGGGYFGQSQIDIILASQVRADATR